MVIRHKVFAPLRGQSKNLCPHPANREVAMLSIKDNKLIFENPARELEIFVEDEVVDEADDHLLLCEIPEKIYRRG